MIKISEVVRQVVQDDEVALQALAQGVLNLSAYAQLVGPKVERLTKKSTKPGSIVVALSRLSPTIRGKQALLPKIVLTHISAASGLVEFAYPKTSRNRRLLTTLYSKPEIAEAGFFTVTQGVSEISIMTTAVVAKLVQRVFGSERPKYLQAQLSALTVLFDEKYMHVPNFTYAVLRELAVRRVNIVEMQSTYTELTFILDQKDLQRCFGYLSTFINNGD